MLFNIAYLYALKGEKEKSFQYVKQSFQSNPSNSKILLLFVRILRSNCQFKAVLDLVSASRHILDRWDLFLCIEAMYSAAESNDFNLMTKYFKKIRKNWKNDVIALKNLVKVNLMIKKTNDAMEIMKSWAEFDVQSSDYFFCFSQISLVSKSVDHAKRFILYAVELDPSNVIYLAALSQIHLELGEPKEALTIALTAIHLDPNNIYAWIAYAACLEGKESQEANEKLLKLRVSYVDLSNLDLILTSFEKKTNLHEF